MLRPGAAPVPEETAPHLKLRPHRIAARIELPDGAAEGVLVAQGGRFGGFSFYVRGGTPPLHRQLRRHRADDGVEPEPLRHGRHVVGVDVMPTSGLGMSAELHVDGQAVARGELPRTAPFRFALAGEGLCCGFDDGTPVADSYESPFRFTGVLHEAVIDVGGATMPDLEAELTRAWVTQ